MTRRPRVLLLSFDGLPGTVIESQVLLLARELRTAGIADFEVCVVACFDGLYTLSLGNRQRAQELAGVPVHVIRGIRPAVPFAAAINALRVWRQMRRTGGRFTYLQGRPDHGALVAGLIARLSGAKAVWDCRGDSLAELVERPRAANPLLRALVSVRLLTVRMTAWLAGRLCHRAIFVSSVLRDARRGCVAGKPVEVIPGVASPEMFFFDATLRARTRAALGYHDHNVVFVYSGSMAYYQCFAETVALFRDYLRDHPEARLLVITLQTEIARACLDDLPAGAVDLRSATFTEVNSYLNAADCGFLLRAARLTNAAASPTKFAEYGLAGLPVVMRDTVPDSHAIAARNGNLVECTDGRLGELPALDRAEVSRRYRGMLSRRCYLPAYERLYAP